MCQGVCYHNFIPVMTSGLHNNNQRQAEQVTEDQGLHKQFYLVSKSDPMNSGAHLTLENFSILS